jgi:copper(I)-binding protein
MRGLKLALTLLPLALLAGCQPAAKPAGNASVPVTIRYGKLVLPAVKGNPGAAYFTLTNDGHKPLRLAAVDVAGAGMAMFHETMDMDGHSTMQDMKTPDVQAGASLTFSPGGRHVMVHDVPASLALGSSVTMTITFADGGKITAPLAVTAPGDIN